jgi:hypothetical protein
MGSVDPPTVNIDVPHRRPTRADANDRFRSTVMISLVPESANRRLVIVVRAGSVICGHSGEARNLAEFALTRGFHDVRIVTWPIEQLSAVGLPLKPIDSVLPYSNGITVERPEPVGD